MRDFGKTALYVYVCLYIGVIETLMMWWIPVSLETAWPKHIVYS